MDHRERLLLVRRLLRWAYQETNTFREANLASQLLYLIMAIIEDSHIELDPADPDDNLFVNFLSRDKEIWDAVNPFIQPAV